MALTREYGETDVAPIKRDRKFARALYAEALSALMDGETAEGLSMLRDLVHAQITFKELARQTGLGEKTLHRMLNRNGNPTARNLGVIVKKIAEDLRIRPRVEVAATGCPPTRWQRAQRRLPSALLSRQISSSRQDFLGHKKAQEPQREFLFEHFEPLCGLHTARGVYEAARVVAERACAGFERA